MTGRLTYAQIGSSLPKKVIKVWSLGPQILDSDVQKYDVKVTNNILPSFKHLPKIHAFG